MLPRYIPENLLKTTRLELESNKKVLPFRYLQKITRTRTQNKLWAGCQFCGISETIHISSLASTLPCIYQVGTLHNVVNHSDYIHEFQISLYILVLRLWFQMSLGFSYHCSHQPWQTWVSIFLTQLLTWDGIKHWSIYTQDTPSLLNCTYPMHWMEAWSLSAWIHFFHWEIAECTYSLHR